MRGLLLSLIGSSSFSVLSRALCSTPLSSVPSGVVAVFKPIGWTSADVTNKLKHILIAGEKERLIASGQLAPNTKYKSKIKIGHGGTLDPMAEGVLVIGVGSGTKLLEGYLSGSKGYEATALLGEERDTQDASGNVTETKDCSHITYESLKNAIGKFQGEISQVPPMYSALKHKGQRLYDLARKGLEIEREARTVHVYKLDLSIPRQLPEFSLSVECGGGLYIRTLIVDLARAVSGRAHMTALLRIKQGIFTLEDCVHKNDWNFESICNGIVRCTEKRTELERSVQ